LRPERRAGDSPARNSDHITIRAAGGARRCVFLFPGRKHDMSNTDEPRPGATFTPCLESEFYQAMVRAGRRDKRALPAQRRALDRVLARGRCSGLAPAPD